MLKLYTNTRRGDDRNNKDTPRRYPFVDITEDDYPKIYKVVHKVLTDYPETKKYLE